MPAVSFDPPLLPHTQITACTLIIVNYSHAALYRHWLDLSRRVLSDKGGRSRDGGGGIDIGDRRNGSGGGIGGVECISHLTFCALHGTSASTLLFKAVKTLDSMLAAAWFEARGSGDDDEGNPKLLHPNPFRLEIRYCMYTPATPNCARSPLPLTCRLVYTLARRFYRLGGGGGTLPDKKVPCFWTVLAWLSAGPTSRPTARTCSEVRNSKR